MITVRPARTDEFATIAGTPARITASCSTVTARSSAWLGSPSWVGRPARTLDRLSGDLQSVYVVPDARNGGLGGLLVAIPAYARRGFAPSPTLLIVDF